MSGTWDILVRAPKGTLNEAGRSIAGTWMKMSTEIEIGFILYGDAMVRDRAERSVAALRDATPVDTGETAMGWEAVPRGKQWSVVNRHQASDGFLVASGLITGTGSRGRAIRGFSGTFARDWPGMKPSKSLRAEWQNQISEPVSVISFQDWMKSSGKSGSFH